MKIPYPISALILKAVYSQGLTASLLLLAAAPGAAQTGTAYTTTCWAVGAVVPPILVTNSPGQILIRGGLQTLRVESTNPRLAGLRRVFLDGAYLSDGSGILYGSAYQEAGTWDLTDPATPQLSLSAGVWELLYRGTISADLSLSLHVVGRGVGGIIDGERLEENLTRAPGDLLGSSIPWQGSGTLSPPPVNKTQVLDNFEDSKSSAWTAAFGATLTEANGRFTVRDYWPGVITRDLLDTVGAGYLSRSATAKEGQTLEYRVDLVRMSEGASAANLELVSTGNSAYLVFKGRDFIHVCKPTWLNGFQHAHLIQERVTTPNSNVVISLSLTRVSPNLVVTARILDKSNHEAVLYERAVVDTPGVDPSLTSAEILAASGMHLAAGKDIASPPPYSIGSVGLHVWQYNADGKQPAAEATFDNLELRIHEMPPIAASRAVRLTWLTPAGGAYSVEGAPSVQGPWIPVRALDEPGLTQAYVPNDALLQFFRLREAP